MSEQITLRLDDHLVEHGRARAAASGSTLTDWVRTACRRQAALEVALQARSEEDARGPLYTDDQEEAIMRVRARRALASFADPQADPDGANPDVAVR